MRYLGLFSGKWGMVESSILYIALLGSHTASPQSANQSKFICVNAFADFTLRSLYVDH